MSESRIFLPTKFGSAKFPKGTKIEWLPPLDQDVQRILNTLRDLFRSAWKSDVIPIVGTDEYPIFIGPEPRTKAAAKHGQKIYWLIGVRYPGEAHASIVTDDDIDWNAVEWPTPLGGMDAAAIESSPLPGPRD